MPGVNAPNLPKGLIDRQIVSAGAGVALAIAIPTILLESAVDATVGIDRDSNVLFLFYVPVLVGLVVGGWWAGRRRTDAPLTHGALAAFAAYVVVALLTTIVRLAAGHSIDGSLLFALVFNGLLAASAGILGGLLATRRRRLQ